MAIYPGDEVRDTVTGFKGIVVCRSEFLNKCVRLSVQPQELKDGKTIDPESFDEEQLEVIKSAKIVTTKAVQTGGDHRVTTARKDVSKR
jgi:hypothetical protein